MVRERIPQRFGFDPMDDIQVLTPMQRGRAGRRNLNLVLQAALNPDRARASSGSAGPSASATRSCRLVNDYDKDVFNGDIGRIASDRRGGAGGGRSASTTARSPTTSASWTS